MTSGGREVDVGGGGGGRCPSTNLCAINDRASFLPVKSSTVDLKFPWVTHGTDLSHPSHGCLMGLI